MFAPSIIDGNQVNTYEDRLLNTTGFLYNNFNTTLLSLKNGSNANVYTQLSPVEVGFSPLLCTH